MSHRPFLLALLFVGVLGGLAALAASRTRTGPARGTLSVAGPLIGGSATDVVKVAVEADGVYRLDAALLGAAGFDLAGADPGRLRLTLRGRDVPFYLAGADRGRALIFYGQANPGTYSATTIYWLTVSAQGSARYMAERAAAPQGVPVEAGMARLRLEEDRIYHPEPLPDEDHWLWEALYGPGRLTRTLNLPLLAAGEEATLVVALWSGTNAPISPDHHVSISLNDRPLADDRWDGMMARLITATIPAGVLHDGANTLVINAPGDTGAPVDQVFLDWIQLDYPRRLSTNDGLLAFTGTAITYYLKGFGDDALLLDITDPAQPVRLTGAVTAGDEITFGSMGDKPHHYLVVGALAFRRPVSVTPARLPTLKQESGGADYLAIVPAAFSQAIQPLLDWRAKNGLRVRTVDPADIYDTYSYGMKDPAAIRDFLRDVHSRWQPPPRFVLLVGDASYDYRNVLQGKNRDIVPTSLVYTQFAGETASDTWYAEDDQGRPLFAIGRLPAQTPEQVATMVGKIIAYEQAPPADWRTRMLAVADDEDPAFESLNEQLIAALPPGYSAERIYFNTTMDQKDRSQKLHQAIVAAFNHGVSIVNYIGHGSLDVWGDEQALTVKNAADLKNGDRLPVLTTYTCLNGFFQHPQADSLAEVLLWLKDGGIVGAVVPSGRSLAAQQAPLAQAFYAALFDPKIPTLGEALERAQTNLSSNAATPLEVIETFNLLGDPALRFRQ